MIFKTLERGENINTYDPWTLLGGPLFLAKYL